MLVSCLLWLIGIECHLFHGMLSIILENCRTITLCKCTSWVVVILFILFIYTVDIHICINIQWSHHKHNYNVLYLTFLQWGKQSWIWQHFPKLFPQILHHFLKHKFKINTDTDVSGNIYKFYFLSLMTGILIMAIFTEQLSKFISWHWYGICTF